VDGVKTAFQIKNSNQVQTVTIRLAKIEHNVALDDAIFSVKAPRP
jgi:outer membrane lipoprotein-sorting protein